ncbi:MAG: trehalose 6-phosphate synthase/phosphatase [Ignavibacteria bacterium]|nr:MAG: trehalose 6-phosphate synthase/phosphatase [Ignavibacteria bacterium]KAF0160496.1 MAG: trehalose 6-phosphate synthase/phosphatase [Ignavibacteria bacterium]
MFSTLTEKYKTAVNKLILLDYDGTLVDFVPTPERAKPSAHLLNTLRTISNQPQTEVIIISGRLYFDIDRFLGVLPLNIIAEHGAMVKENGKWKKQIVDYRLWKQSVLPIFNRFALTCPNSFVEEKEYSLTWHYRNAQLESGHEHSRELIRALKDSARSYNLRIIDGNKIVEVMNNDIDKGKAVKKMLKQNEYDYVLSIGDDQTDEDMFCALSDYSNTYTIKVGEGETFAKYRVKSVSEVLNLLEQLSK